MIPLPPFSVKLDIVDVAYVTYLVPGERLRPAVPEKIAFAMTHEGKAFVSLVMFHNRNVRASLFPFIRFNYDQLNVRTYIIDPVTGKTAVLFLHSGITSGIMSFATRLLGIPWPAISLDINGGQQNGQTGYSAAGQWAGEIAINLQEVPEPLDYTPFRNMKEAIDFLVKPTVGFYNAPGGVIRFEVRHTFEMPGAGKAMYVRFPLLENRGYLGNEELQNPQTVLFTHHGFFRVLLPPKHIRL